MSLSEGLSMFNWPMGTLGCLKSMAWVGGLNPLWGASFPWQGILDGVKEKLSRSKEGSICVFLSLTVDM